VHDPIAVSLETGPDVVGLLGYGSITGTAGEGGLRP
jgi:hypothetical protein